MEKETGLLRARLLAGSKVRSRVGKAIIALCCVVAFCTTYALILPAITANATAYCGIEEHEHTDACYEKVLVCGLEEGEGSAEADGEAGEESTAQGHVHDESCYETRLVCGEEEHVHTLACYSNPNADLETAEMWEKTVPTSDELCGEWATDLLSVAKSQLGYEESTENYQVASDGATTKGYTRYGAWYGDPYGDWCAMFASFCLHYAGVDEEKMPLDANCQSWVEKLQKTEQETIKADKDDPLPARYRAAVDDEGKAYEPAAGDLIFFSSNISSDKPVADHVGIVEKYIPATSSDPASITTIEGNSSNMVERNVYLLSDERIMGYGILPEQVFYCGQEGHIHSNACMESSGELSCDLPEHKHTDACLQVSSQSDENEENSGKASKSAAKAATLSATTLALSDDKKVSHNVTFKVMIDGQWQEVGSLPNYYSGTVDGSERAYITSDMAAQFFGDYGYKATDAPGNHFGYSYNDIYTLFYANGATKTNYCMDIDGGTLQDAQVVQLYTSNGTDAQVFRIRDAGDGYSFITPIGDSDFHVNVYGYSIGDSSSTQLKLSTATNANSQWKVDTGDDGRTTFWSALAPDDQVIDLNNGEIADGGKLQVWHSTGGARYWYLDQQFRISNNTVSEQNSDDTYTIGLTAESNGDIVCYYMPAETECIYTEATEGGISANNSFWSVTVRDDTNTVYLEDDLSKMVQYAANGGEATVKVKNADGILWSVSGASDVTSTQAGGYTIFVIRNITQPVEVVATKANPSFTVQYYANIPRFATSGDTSLTVIDTSGKALPTNGGSMATKNIYLEGTGENTNQNNGDATPLYRVKTTTELTKMYSEQKFKYQEAPGLQYFNKLKDNEDYTLNEIWVLKSGKEADSTNREDWDIYSYQSDTAFTNEAGLAVGNTILIADGTVLRLVSDASTGVYHNETTFYDYNISSGQNEDGRWLTGITGINSKSNYGTSLNGERNWESGADVFAFGNMNCGTGMSGYLFDGGPLNKYNSKNSSYGGCTFGLASGLNSDGTICYNEWIVAPKLFNDGDATGKQTYTGSSLTFERTGDTYTLSSATLNNSNEQSNTLSGLQYFFNPSPTSGTTHSRIFTNNFWPMDQAADRTDALWGTYGNPGTFQGFMETNDLNWAALADNFPVSDDGNAHNWFFGMNFSLSFNLTADYVGPLEYYFFGDDDLWVFLDGQLVCDIGGVHSSIGEYVNLRDYLPAGSSGQHTLSFFYTERGASGSTCYMSFTLPSVSSAITSQDIGSLQLSKQIEAPEDSDFSEEEYEFQVELLTKEHGQDLMQTFSYVRSDGTYGTVKSGGTIKLKPEETATISGIPAGTYYCVTETAKDGYIVIANGTKGYIASGTIETGKVDSASFVNKVHYEMPNTGGLGTTIFYIIGVLLVLGAVIALVVRRRSSDKYDR